MPARYDIGALSPPTKLSNGYLRVDGVLTRSGVFQYRNPDGTMRSEYRPPDEVFRGDSMASFGLKPVTNEHPAEGLLDTKNTQQYQVGTVGENVRRDGAAMRGSLLITDAKTIADMQAGKQALSCGYNCKIKNEPGVTPSGERYDCVQYDIEGNHLAIVPRGRAGEMATVRMDADDAQQINSGEEIPVTSQEKDQTMNRKVRLDGIDFDVSDQVAQAIDKMRNDSARTVGERDAEIVALKAARDKAQGERDAAVTRADAAEKQVKSAADPATVRAMITARVSLESLAQKHLPSGTRLDTLDDRAIKIAIVEKLAPGVTLAGKSDDYLAARFDAAIEEADKRNPGLARAREAATGGAGAPTTTETRSDAGERDEDQARADMIAENRKRANQPVGAK